VVDQLPAGFNVGLRLYGHREASTSPKTCTDTQLVVPIRPINRDAIVKAAERVKPRGETPLVYSVLQAPGDLKRFGGGSVILITDGEESCKGDPVKAADELKASGLDVRLNIVGFAIAGKAVQKTLTSFAESTGGRFYTAQSGAALAQALIVATIDRLPFKVYDAAGKEVAGGEAGGAPIDLPAGEYKIVVKAGTQDLVAERVKVTLGGDTKLRVTLKENQVVIE
jgi:Ca-activated chloride channel family protein